ncbi:MAG: hypothetical protein ABSC17_04370 [Thermacetogeniaceae bacterium]
MKQHVVNVRLSKVLYDQIKSLVATREEAIVEVIRRLLEQGANTEIVAQGLDTITTAIRKTIRAELKSTENRLAALGAKAGIAASTAEQMVADMVEHANSTPGMTPEEKKRQARFLHEEARKKAIALLKKSVEEWMCDQNGN